MPIEMPKGLPFSVDTWTLQSDRKRHHFLTHSHRDHLAGIASHSSYPIYATKITKSIVLRDIPLLDESVFVEIPAGEPVIVNDPDGDFTVMAFDANHCPGAVMFLFEGEFGNILHTGDCRLTPDCLHYLPMKYITKKGRDNMCHLDYLFLDCTFGRCFLKIPSKQEAIQQVINCIWKHPNAPVVYLACDMLGQEEILVQVSRTFGSKIYVDKTNNSECFNSLSLAAPEILSEDVTSRFQVIEGFPRLNERASQKLADARANLQPCPLFVRPSTQWYCNIDQLETTQVEKPGLSEAVRDEFGVWHVCYSMHSSREELEWALQLLQPKWVISTTPPCRAMELDYVKKHCYKTRITTNDPLWKLLKLGNGKSASLSFSMVSDASNVMVASVARASEVCAESGPLHLEEVSANHIEVKLDTHPPSSTRTAITLFGRARLGLPDIDFLQERSSEPSEVDKKGQQSAALQKQTMMDHASAVHREDTAESCLEELAEAVSYEDNKDGNCVVDELVDAEPTRTLCSARTNNAEVVNAEREVFCIGSSKDLNVSLKKMYRSMNVPVPRPLPSLVELMGGSKRVKLGSESISCRLSYFYNSSHYQS